MGMTVTFTHACFKENFLGWWDGSERKVLVSKLENLCLIPRYHAGEREHWLHCCTRKHNTHTNKWVNTCSKNNWADFLSGKVLVLVARVNAIKGYLAKTVQGRKRFFFGSWGEGTHSPSGWGTHQGRNIRRLISFHPYSGDFSVLFSPGPDPMGWHCMYLGGSSHLKQLNLVNPSWEHSP